MSVAWKAAKRRAAAALGGKRKVRASWMESAPDVEHELLCLEVKYRKRLPALLEKAMNQALRYVTPKKVPAVVLFERGKRGGLVVLRLQDFTDLFGPFLREGKE